MPIDKSEAAMIRLRRWTQVLCLVLFGIIFFHFSLPDGSGKQPRPLANPPASTNLTPVSRPPEPPAPPNSPPPPPKKGDTPKVTKPNADAKDPLKGQDEPAKGTQIHWQKFPEHFPVPTELLITLPTSKPKTPIGRIQATFDRESDVDRNDRLKKRFAIKEALEHSWKGYKAHAWGKDEVGPLTGNGKDNFGGWAATLVDALDTLWIMDMKAEFEEAVEYVHKIDFTVYESPQIRVFETIIRFLGGLIGAYDISGHKYPILLQKAIEVGDVVFGAFDTPNRIPMLYYEWKPEAVAKPKRASYQTGLAELGTLMMEYTRLAQLTGNQSYYDAVQRITDDLEAIQFNTSMPGMWPGVLDGTGGCAGIQPMAPRPITFNPGVNGKKISKRADEDTWRDEKQEERLGDDAKKPTDDPDRPGECIAKGLAARNVPYGVDEYTYGAGSDSYYEYLIKMHLLLGGATDQYANMYKSSMEVGKKLLYRPNIPGNPDVLLAGKILAKGAEKALYFRSETGHLTCFAGGMFAVGSKALNIKEDLEVGAKLTDGCVKIYSITKSGIMPEALTMMKCPDDEKCVWDEIEWMKILAPAENWDLITAKETATATATATKTTTTTATTTPKIAGSKTTPDGKKVGAGAAVIEDDERHPNEIPIEKQQQKPQNANRRRDNPPSPAQIARERAEAYVKALNIPPGVTEVNDRKYMLRPEAIESVFIMWRITGDKAWREKGWEMWQATHKSARTEIAYAQIADVTLEPGKWGNQHDNMESFWFAETLKYYYLLFSEPELVNLDEYVLNTEAHPFKRKTF